MKKTVEAEKLKTEVKDLREIVDLDGKLKDTDENVKDEEFLLKMKKSGSRRNNPHIQSSQEMSKKLKEQEHTHAKGNKKPVEPQFNCKDCYFQGTEKGELEKHITLKHTINMSKQEDAIKCRICGETFKTKWHLMNHRKKDHMFSVALCRNNLSGKCNFTADLCWWNHAERTDDHIGCFVCGENFDNRSSLMVHRKLQHARIVKMCNKFEEMKCSFDAKSCWFKHGEEENVANESNEKNIDSVFQNVPKKKEPPIKTQ